MKTRTISLSLVILSALTFILYSCRHEALPNPNGGGSGGGGTGGGGSSDTTVCFESQILPLYQSSCAMAGCHDATTHTEGYNLTTYAGITARGISPGKPSNSKLYTILSNGMPPSGYTPLSADQKAIISKWISQGAKNTTGCNNSCDTSQFAFTANVQPIMNTYCKGCHSSTNASGGYDLSSHAGVLNALTKKRLLGSIRHEAGFVAMPQGAAQLSACQIRIIEKWADAGAPNN